MDWIVRNLAIGDHRDAQAPDLADTVDTVICLKEGCACRSRDDVIVFTRELVDGAGNSRYRISEILSYLRTAMDDGDRVLVHCHAGRSRSVVIVALYLMVSRGWSRGKALSAISEEREIYLSPGIEAIFARRG